MKKGGGVVIRKIQFCGSVLFVVSLLVLIFYGVPYCVIKYPAITSIPLTIKVALLTTLAGILIVLATVIVEQRRTR